jgi:hypothetical protein
MRRVASLSGGVALAAGVLLVTPVSAAPAQRVSDTEHIMFCDELTGADGTAFLVLGESEQFGSFADAAFWPAGTPPPNDPAWIAMTADADFDGTSVTATILMVEYVPSPDEPPFGDPVGNATVEATLTPDGDPMPYSFQDSFGNQLLRRQGTFQAYTVEGSLTMPNGATFDLSSCGAFSDTYTQFSNAPAASVSRFSSFDLSCGWETEDGFVGLFATAGDFGGFSELFIVDGEDTYFGFPSSELILTTQAFEASYDIVSADDGGDPVGSATASATLTAGDRINERFTSGPFKAHIIGQEYLVDGSLSVTLDGTTTVFPMDETSCFAADVTVMEQFSSGQGPKGRPLANDTPESALPIAIGETITVRNTGGTALEPEVPCVVSFPEGEFDVPLGHTAWWTFTGTGSDVTIDTAGSDFDTVVGVYVDDGGSLTQIGCNDDVDSLQARLTVATEAGVTYYVQVGGFGGQSGSLVLSLE